MSSIINDITNALESRLNTLPGKPAIAWPNRDFTPVSGTSWARPTVIPGRTVAHTMDTDITRGIFQIDIFTQSGIGRASAEAIADAIADHFTPTLSLTSNTTIVRVLSVSVNTARNESDWYHIPLEIHYLSTTANR